MVIIKSNENMTWLFNSIFVIMNGINNNYELVLLRMRRRGKRKLGREEL